MIKVKCILYYCKKIQHQLKLNSKYICYLFIYLFQLVLITIYPFNQDTHLCTDIFCKPLPAFAIFPTAQLAKMCLLLLIEVLPE